jgi:PPOX class probable F420-dependent enzyme
MATLPVAARAVIESGKLGHLVTLNRDGSPQVTCVWVGLDGDELVTAHLRDQQKLRNIRRDPRVAVSFDAEGTNAISMQHYLVIYGRARIREGGAARLLQHLAHTYIGPEARFPPMDEPPPGFVVAITPERWGGLGPWAEATPRR